MFKRRFIPVNQNGINSMAKRIPRNPSDLKFKLLTYNILSPSYMWPKVYHYVPEKYKSWSYRHELLEYELMYRYRADIMCFQEMTLGDYQNFWSGQMRNNLQMGSQFIAKSAPGYWRLGDDELDGCGIFYNLGMFEFISSKGIYLNQLLSAFNGTELEYLSRRRLALTDGCGQGVGETNLLQFLKEKNQVCLFVTLRHKMSGLIFVIINTHLYWKYDEVKLTQCMVIMRELRDIISVLLQGEGCDVDDQVRILFTGDLNSTRDSLVVKFLKGQIINNMDLNMINPMRTYLNRCVYDDIPEEWFDHTCYSGKLKGIFDYVWYHDTHFELDRVLSGKEVSDELRRLGQFGLPNLYHPSDHIPLLTEFKLLE